MIEINNLTSRKIDNKFLKEIAELVLKEEAKKGKCPDLVESNVSIAIVGTSRIKKINNFYRGKNKATDVLSFSEEEVKISDFKIGPTEKYQGLGEVIICAKRVKKNAKRNDVSFKKELAKVLIHGILHLLGYNHKKEEERKIMRKKEEEYLQKTYSPQN